MKMKKKDIKILLKNYKLCSDYSLISPDIDSLDNKTEDEEVPYIIYKVSNPNKKIFRFKKRYPSIYIGITGFSIKRVDYDLIKDEYWREKYTKLMARLYNRMEQFSQITYSINEEIRIIFSFQEMALDVEYLKEKLSIIKESMMGSILDFYPQMVLKDLTVIDVKKILFQPSCAAIIKIMPNPEFDSKQVLLRTIQKNNTIIFDNYEKISNDTLHNTIDRYNDLISDFKTDALTTENFVASTPFMISALLGNTMGKSVSEGLSKSFSKMESNSEQESRTVGNTKGTNIQDWDQSSLEVHKTIDSNFKSMRKYDSFTPEEINNLTVAKLRELKLNKSISTDTYVKLYTRIQGGFSYMGNEAVAGVEGGFEAHFNTKLDSTRGLDIAEQRQQRFTSVEGAWEDGKTLQRGSENVKYSYEGQYITRNQSETESLGSSKSLSRGRTNTEGVTSNQSHSEQRSFSMSGTAGSVRSEAIVRQAIKEGNLQVVDILSSRRGDYEMAIGLGAFMNSMLVLSDDPDRLEDIIASVNASFCSEFQINKQTYVSRIFDPEFIEILKPYCLFEKSFTVKNRKHPIGGIEAYHTILPVFSHQIISKLHPPLEEIPGIIVELENVPVYPQLETDGDIEMGNLLFLGKQRNKKVYFSSRKNHHIGIFGKTGFGKTITSIQIIKQLIDKGYNALIIDPKGAGDYLKLYNIVKNPEQLLYFTFKKDPISHEAVAPLQIDLLRPPKGFEYKEYLKMFLDCFFGSYGLQDRSRMVVSDLILTFRSKKGRHPSLSEILEILKEQQNQAREKHEFDVVKNLNSIIIRIHSFIQIYGDFFDIKPNTGIYMENLLDNYTVILEINNMDDKQDITFITVFLSTLLYKYRKMYKLRDKYHYLIWEEIGSIFPRTEDSTADVLYRKIGEIMEQSREYNLRIIYCNQMAADFQEKLSTVLGQIDVNFIQRLSPRDDRNVLGGLFGWQDANLRGYGVEKLRHLFRLRLGESIFKSKELLDPIHIKIIPSFPLHQDIDYESITEGTKRWLKKNNYLEDPKQESLLEEDKEAELKGIFEELSNNDVKVFNKIMDGIKKIEHLYKELSEIGAGIIDKSIYNLMGFKLICLEEGNYVPTLKGYDFSLIV
ncbi:MAG: DUF87 domain-containing protein [Candidatus Lokiarchaeota archaeon]|nr:DUF87 domain-containing protein [Candidatus Lokiarchaeota archaeon]